MHSENLLSGKTVRTKIARRKLLNLIVVQATICIVVITRLVPNCFVCVISWNYVQFEIVLVGHGVFAVALCAIRFHLSGSAGVVNIQTAA